MKAEPARCISVARAGLCLPGPRGIWRQVMAATLAIVGTAGLAVAQSPPGFGLEAPDLPTNFATLAQSSGEPQIPGLAVIYLHPLGAPAAAQRWKHILVHQTEGPAGSARYGAREQAANPTRRGVTLWVETDGTVYWATAETAIPTHGDGANRNDNKYIDNSATYRTVIKSNTIGVEFAGNYPDVARPPTPAQRQAWSLLVRLLQERYDIPAEHIYAHNWIDFKDARYCEGCELAAQARALGYVPSTVRGKSQ
jgi:hypothetical protein